MSKTTPLLASKQFPLAILITPLFLDIDILNANIAIGKN